MSGNHLPPVLASTEEMLRRQTGERKANVRRDPVITKIRQRPVGGNWHADRAIDLLAKTALTEAQKTRLRELLG